jgi:hypothetical protein
MAPAGRVPYRPRISAAGIISAVVGAVGILLFLQQRGKVFPTAVVGAATLVAGVVAGIVLPSLGLVVATRRLNRRLELLDRLDGPDPEGPAATG